MIQEMHAYLEAAQKDDNLSHKRNYLAILERMKSYMTVEEYQQFLAISRQVKEKMSVVLGYR